ncbi:rab9 effector protein with kelch motifs isoform X1 [Narcine bancroftii]|uniref:rab9 effector protein with kelch motifs isoform X1 n=1 Tax=Narcine bancroftii TaxID=1343680 RepID=UPI0038316300
MELSVLEPEESPQIATWYAFVPRGESPDVRVGHTLTYIPEASGKGKVVIVGGANPNGSFSDAHILELDRHEWNVPEWKGLLPRYEHATFAPDPVPAGLWLFGGADEHGNRNCIQALNFETGEWKIPKVSGTPPTPRTCHASTATIGNCLYIFGGGYKGAEPVQDPQLHAFDKAAVNKKWIKVNMKGDIPGGRAAHSAVSHEKYIFIFGGLDTTGALNTMYKYHIETQCWTLFKFDSSLPPKRLDHAMCVIPWKIRKLEIDTSQRNDKLPDEGNKECKNGNNVDPATMKYSALSQTDNIVYLCLIFGGMDTQGEVYNDCFVTLLQGY